MPARDRALTWKIDYLYDSLELLRMNGTHCLSLFSLTPRAAKSVVSNLVENKGNFEK